MSTTLAASAAAFELPDDGPVDFEQLVQQAEGPSPLIVRDALLALAAVNRETDDVKTLKAQIVDRYDHRIGQLAKRAAEIRAGIDAYVRRFGKVSFPDVGGAHLSTQAKGGKVRVADAVAFADWFESNFQPDESMYVHQLRLDAALERVMGSYRHTADGKMIDPGSGEVVELPGVEVVAESKTLAVRKP